MLSTNIRYELKAYAFYRMTGELAPGKDVSPERVSASFDERYDLWIAWLEQNGECINAMLSAVNVIIEPDAEE